MPNHMYIFPSETPSLMYPIMPKFHRFFRPRISSLSNACNYRVRDRRHIRHILDLKTASAIAISLEQSKLDYFNSLPTAKINISSPVIYCKTLLPAQ